jgi:hypothetical protein
VEKHNCLFYNFRNDSKIISDYSRRRRASPLKLPHCTLLEGTNECLCTNAVDLTKCIWSSGVRRKQNIARTNAYFNAVVNNRFVYLTHVRWIKFLEYRVGRARFSGTTGFRLSLTLSLSRAFGMTALKLLLGCYDCIQNTDVLFLICLMK